VHRADNLTTFMCRLSWNLGSSTFWNPLGLSRHVKGLLYLYFYLILSSSFSIPERTMDVFLFKGTALSSGRRVSRAFCQGMKRLEREADHPLPISRNIKSGWIYTRTAPYIFMALDLIIDRDKLNFFISVNL